MTKSIRAMLAPLLACAAAQASFAAEQGGVPPSAVAMNAFARTCVYCHNPKAGAPELFGRQLPADYVKFAVRSGVRSMPAFRPTEITKEELEALATIISSSGPSVPAK